MHVCVWKHMLRTYTYPYMYPYSCVCVCVCKCTGTLGAARGLHLLLLLFLYRAVAPLAPEKGFVAIRLATNPRSRKVEELQRDNQAFVFLICPATNIFMYFVQTLLLLYT